MLHTDKGLPRGTTMKHLPASAGDMRDGGSKIPWRRAWQPTPVSLPGEAHGQRSLVGYGPQAVKSWTRLKQQQGMHTHTND